MLNSMDDVFGKLQEMAERYPGSIALASRAGFQNYESLMGNIASASFAAARSGIKPGHLVVVAVENQDAAIILGLALMRMGCRLGISRNLDLYDNSNVPIDAIIADKMARDLKRPVIETTPDWFVGNRADRRQLPPVASDGSLISSSSGSTGRPKLMEHGAAALCWRFNLRAEYFSKVPFLRHLSLIGRRTSYTFMDSLVTLLCGGTAIHPVDSQPETILETIQIYRPDYISVAPKPLIDILRMLEARPMRLPKAKSLRSAGAYFSPHVQETALEHISEEVVSSYGSAETSWTAWGTSEEIRKIPGSVGRIPMGIEVATFDSMGEQLPVGAEGAIRVKCTEDLAPIYLDDQAGAQSNFKDGWFSTGDTGFVDENRHLIFRGRANNIINLGGNKINPEILEEQLLTFSGIVDVGVVGVDDPDGFQQVCAAIVSTSKQTVDEINQQFHQRRQRHAVQLVMNVEAIPKTENGKIDRTALKRLCAE